MTCPVCVSPRVRLDFTTTTSDTMRCSDCGHRHAGSRPASPRIVYDENYYHNDHKNWNLHPDVGYFSWIGEQIATLSVHNPSVLDVGCGAGGICRFLSQHHPTWSILGVDPSAQAENSGNLTFRGGLADDLISEQRTFDVVMTHMVIEHVHDVPGFVASLAKLSRPGGLIIINTINDASMLYRLSRFLMHCGARGPVDRLYSAHHTQHFSRSTLWRACQSIPGRKITHRTRNIPLNSVDLPPVAWPIRMAYLSGIAAIFGLAACLPGCGYQQTVLIRSPA